VNCARRISRLDQGELITIPLLLDAADWQEYEVARLYKNCNPINFCEALFWGFWVIGVIAR
jgi:hypothetical protein